MSADKPFDKSSFIILISLLTSLALGSGIYFSDLSADIALTAGITLFVAILWVTEALPIPATSLIRSPL